MRSEGSCGHPAMGAEANVPTSPARSELRTCAVVFLLAIVVRVAYLAESAAGPTFRAPIVDSRVYDGLARSFARGDGFRDEFFWQPFFYPFFLSLMYLVSGGSILFAKAVQIGVGAVTCVLTYRLGRRLFGRSAGVTAGVVTAVYGPLLFLEAELVGEGWAAFWSVVLLLLFLGASSWTRLGHAAVLGACGAAAILTRPTFLPFFVAGCVWLAFSLGRRSSTRRRVVPGLAAAAAGFLSLAGPVAVLAHRSTGSFTFLPTSGGLNLYIGNNPTLCQTLTARPGTEYDRLTAMPDRKGIRNAAGRQRYFYRLVREFAAEQPLPFLKGMASKTAHFFSSREIPRNLSVYEFRRYSMVLSGLVWRAGAFGFPFGVLLPLAVLGLVVRRREVAAPLLLFVIVYPLSVILVFASGRYRVPVIPAMAVLAGAGGVWLVEVLRSRRWAPATKATACLVALAAAASWPGPFCMEKVDYETELDYCLAGDAWKHDGRADEAVERYSRVLQRRPDHVDARLNLGALFLQIGRPAEAAEQYREAQRLRPDEPAAYNGLGLASAQAGNLSEAVKQYAEAVRIDPLYTEARCNLANALSELGERDAAVAQYFEALRRRPDSAAAHNGLGLIRLQEGRLTEAAAHFYEALRSDPRAAEACNNLGLVMLQRGDTDAAVQFFRKAVSIRPNYAEAHANAGLVLAQQQRYEEAMRHYGLALEAQPGLLNAQLGLADALGVQGRWDEAERAYRRAVDQHSRAAIAHLFYANALERQGRLDEAIERYREVLRLSPDHAEARSRLDAALRKQKRTAGAVE